MADIPKDTNIYLKAPGLSLPERKGTRGRKATRLKITGRTTKVSTIASQTRNTQFKEVILRRNKEGKDVKAKFFICPA